MTSMYTIEYLLSHSNLPGPRGNLELLYAFSKAADEEVVRGCLARIRPETANSPEEFVGMCGIVGYAVLHGDRIAETLAFIRQYANHPSWRLREAVAIAVQEIAAGRMAEVLDGFRPWIAGAFLERRAVVAALCEPKLLKIVETSHRVLAILKELTDGFDGIDTLDEGQKVLRQALGYGWSVAIAAQPTEGKRLFESLRDSSNKHIRWIVKENLKKNRLIKLDPAWVQSMAASFA
jgi:hypothetical protein